MFNLCPGAAKHERKLDAHGGLERVLAAHAQRGTRHGSHEAGAARVRCRPGDGRGGGRHRLPQAGRRGRRAEGNQPGAGGRMLRDSAHGRVEESPQRRGGGGVVRFLCHKAL